LVVAKYIEEEAKSMRKSVNNLTQEEKQCTIEKVDEHGCINMYINSGKLLPTS
jgi:hypothetical protein